MALLLSPLGFAPQIRLLQPLEALDDDGGEVVAKSPFQNALKMLKWTPLGMPCGLACGQHTGRKSPEIRARATVRATMNLLQLTATVSATVLMRPSMRPYGCPHEIPDLAFSSNLRATVLLQ